MVTNFIRNVLVAISVAIVSFIFRSHGFISTMYDNVAGVAELTPILTSLITSAESQQYCVQYPPLYPNEYTNTSLDYFASDEFRDLCLKRLSGAVHIPTETFDDLGQVGEDDRWDIFYEFASYLKETFPLVHSKLELQTPNTHNLVYTWHGRDSSLPPILLMAHQDVVPILPETIDLWEYPPFSAHFDGEFIWGRGSFDTKNSLIGILSALELLLSANYVPDRTIIAAFGFDEEISGPNGAKYIAKHLEQLYGTDYPFLSIIDEGPGLGRLDGVNWGGPAIAEKGYADLTLTVHTNGGHSSMPPDHTGIGKMGKLISLIEDTPWAGELSHKSPMLTFLQCIAYNSDQMSSISKMAILNADKSRLAKRAVLASVDKQELTRYLVRTSQAIDIVHGGLKINALPEKVEISINHRIDVHSSVAEVIEKLIGNMKVIAAKYDMAVVFNGTYYLGSPESDGYFEIDFYGKPLEPSPIADIHGEAWRYLAGSIRHVFQDFAGAFDDSNGGTNSGYKGENVIVAPLLMPANTDSRHYWNLTKNIYRFNPVRPNTFFNYHTVNERIALDAHVETTVFFHEYIKIATQGSK